MKIYLTASLAIAIIIILGVSMWPFNKNISKLTLPLANECKWEMLSGKYKGEPIIVRRNQTVNSLKRHPDLTIKIGFAVLLNRPKKGGLPDPEENVAMNSIEDLIEAEMRKDHATVYVMAITMGTFKEFVFYAKKGGDITITHKRLIGLIKDHDVQCSAQNDPTWSAYDMF